MPRFIFALLSVAAFAEEPFSFEKTPGRLPKDVIPSHYAIRIEPDVAAAKFSGAVDIDVVATKATRSFVLNTAGLVIAKAAADDAALVVKVDDAGQLLTLTAASELAAA